MKVNSMHVALGVVTAFAALGMSLVGCSVPVEGQASPMNSSPFTNESGVSLTPSAAPLPEELDFGGTMIWNSGTQVTVAHAGETKVSQYHRKPGFKAQKFDITLTNGTAEAIGANLMMVSATINGRVADQVFDSANGITGAPNSDVLPGKSVTWSVVFFSPTEGGEMQIDVSPTFNSETAYWVGTV